MNCRLIVCMFAAAALAAGAEESSRNFPVQFSGCNEYVGTGPVPLAQAAPFVPAPFAIADDGAGNATLVVRAASCSSVTVDGASRPEAAVVAHIGISIVSPDGTGAINNYTIAHATGSQRMAQRLERAGLPVLVDSDLVYEVTPNPPVATSELYVEVSPDRGAAGWSITGAVTNNTLFTIPFLANWWYKSRDGVIKMATDIPAITFKAAQATVITRRGSALGRLLGANSFSQFGARASDFNVRGEFGAAQMNVTVR